MNHKIEINGQSFRGATLRSPGDEDPHGEARSIRPSHAELHAVLASKNLQKSNPTLWDDFCRGVYTPDGHLAESADKCNFENSLEYLRLMMDEAQLREFINSQAEWIVYQYSALGIYGPKALHAPSTQVYILLGSALAVILYDKFCALTKPDQNTAVEWRHPGIKDDPNTINAAKKAFIPNQAYLVPLTIELPERQAKALLVKHEVEMVFKSVRVFPNQIAFLCFEYRFNGKTIQHNEMISNAQTILGLNRKQPRR